MPVTRDMVAEFNPDALFVDDHDSALIGVAERCGMLPVAAYDYEKMIENLMADGMDREGAIEFFDFNIVGAWVGDNTPVYVHLLKDEASNGRKASSPKKRNRKAPRKAPHRRTRPLKSTS